MNRKLLLTLFLLAFLASVGFASANLTQVILQPQSNFMCNATGTIYYSLSNNQLMLCTSGSGASPVLTSSGSGGTSASFSTLTVSGQTTLATNGTSFVGIGTSSPGVALDVYGSGSWSNSGGIRLTGNNPGIQIKDLGSGQSWLIANGVNAGNDGYLGLAYDMVHTRHNIVVTPSGYIGIETTTPGTTLDVNGNINVGSVLYDRANTNYYVNPSGNIMPYSANFGTGINVNGLVNVPLAPAGSAYGVQVGGPYALTFQGDQDCSANSFIFQNAYSVQGNCSGSAQAFKWETTHSTFGSRGIGFLYGTGSGNGIIFYADSAAATQGTAFTPTARMIINNAGNVGVGTVSPRAMLEVNGTALFDNQVTINGSSVVIGNGTQGTQNMLLSSGYDPGSANRQINIMQILNSGTANQFLFLGGALGSTAAIGSPTCTSPFGACFGIEGTDFNLNLIAAPAGTNVVPSIALSIISSGNVGIGTTAPTTAGLVVSTNVAGAAVDVQNNRIINVGTPVNPNDAATMSYVNSVLGTGGGGTSTGSFATLAVTGTTTLATVSGNVGIGTTTPVWPLTVYSPSSSFLITAKNSANNPSIIGAVNNTNSTYVGTEGGTGGQTIVGTLPDASFLANQNAYPLQLGTNNNIRMTINSSGNVGIGTTTPATTLDVNGNINVGSVLYDRANTNYYVNPSGNVMPYAANFGTGINVASDVAAPALRASYSYPSPVTFSSDNMHRQVFYELESGGNNPAHYVKIASLQVLTNGYVGSSIAGDIQFGASYRGGVQAHFSLDCNEGPSSNLGCSLYGTGSQNALNQLTFMDYQNANGSYLDRVDVYISMGWYSTAFGALDIYSGGNTSVTVWQGGSDVGTSTPNGGTVLPWNYGYSIMASNVGIKTTNAPYALSVAGSMYSVEVDNGTATGATTIDWSKSNTQTLVLGGSPIALTFTNGQSGGHYTLALKQDATGSRLVTWPANVRWSSGVAPTLTTTANKTDYAEFVYDGLSSTFDGVGFNANF